MRKRFSKEIIALAGNHRVSHPHFQSRRLMRAAFTDESAPAEVFVGGWLLLLRGVTVVIFGYVYPAVGVLLSTLGMTSDRMGFLLMATGLAQVLATGTHYFRIRAGLAFAGALLCLSMWLSYVSVDLEGTVIGWGWFALMVAETALAWRILLTRIAALEAARAAHDAQEKATARAKDVAAAVSVAAVRAEAKTDRAEIRAEVAEERADRAEGAP